MFFDHPTAAPLTAALACEFSMTDAFEVQGEFAPAQSDDFAAAAIAFHRTELESKPRRRRSAQPLPNGFVKLGLAPELIAAVEDLGFTQPTAVQEQAIPLAMGAGGSADDAAALRRPDGLQPDRQRQDRRLPAARAAHAAAAAGRSRSRRQGRASAPGRRSRRPRRSAAQEAQAQGPDQPAPLQGRHARRAGAVPHARARAAGGARRHRPGQALPRPAHRQRGGRHALPAADRPAAERRPRGRHARPPAGPAALDADQARPGAVPGRRRGRPHAGPRLRRRPGRSQPAHHRAPADHDVQRHLRAAHPAAGARA